MGALKSEYSKATDGRQSFEMLINNETSGVSRDEIRELVKSGGKLTDAQELFYSVEGAAPTRTRSRRSSRARRPGDRRHQGGVRAAASRPQARGRCARRPSGREDLDVGHTLKHGDPDTFAKQLAEAKTRRSASSCSRA
jgi:hypothetical protein